MNTIGELVDNLKSINGDTLRPYQKEFILTKAPHYRHIATFDEMGVGKTIQCIAVDLLRREESTGSTLVVAPLTGVIDQWVEAFSEWAPHLTVRRINPKKRELLLKEQADVYIIHPEGLHLMQEELVKIKWNHFIFDEVHKIKNRKTKTAKAAIEVGKSSRFRTGATGTPMENRPDEMWHILKWMYPDKDSREEANIDHWTKKLLNSYWRFYERYMDYFVTEEGYHDIQGTKNEQELRDLFGPFYIRRLKSEVMSDLPPKIYQTYHVDLLPKQRKAYNQMKDMLLAWVGENEDQPVVAPVVIAQLIRLQQFALGYGEIKTGTKIKWEGNARKEIPYTQFLLHEPSVKLDALMDILDDLGDKQCVVYTTSKQAVSLAHNRFKKANIPAGVITGDVPQQLRTSVLRDFKEGKTKILIATIRSGGVGLNLQHCDTMVFLDRDWSPAKNQQAEDRLHRSGQANRVHIIDIAARDTIDQKKNRTLEKKWTWIRDTIGA